MHYIPENDAKAMGGPLPWLESFCVGAKHIDAEHQAMIEACNDLCAVAGRGATARELRVLIAELIASVESHFASEETLFPLIRFPAIAQHLSEHETIRRRLATLLAPIAHGDGLVERARQVRTMLVEHILRHDMGYKTWVLNAVGM